jgi:uncharacterized protein YdeI (YjbR/CyaY-like superfamily)
MPATNPKVDAYIANAQPFAEPILEHLRALVHSAAPEVEESVKWSRPFFEFRGQILCHMAAFKEHCAFDFWGEEMKAEATAAATDPESKHRDLGRIRSLADLPPDVRMSSWLRKAAAMIESGKQASPIAARGKSGTSPRPELETPADFAAALQRNVHASRVFAGFSPSCRREYLEWVAEAKRPETREKRIATALEWIGEGKTRNWRYEARG